MSDGWSYSLKYDGGRVELPIGHSVLGRSRSCDVSITGASVSRRHLDLTAADGKVALIDLSSSNGTLLNGEPIVEDCRADDGDLLQLGDIELLVEIRRLTPDPARFPPTAFDEDDEEEEFDAPRMIRGRDVATLAPPLAEPPTKALQAREVRKKAAETSEAETLTEVPANRVREAKVAAATSAKETAEATRSATASDGLASRVGTFFRDLLGKGGG